MLTPEPLSLTVPEWTAAPWAQVAYGVTVGAAAVWLAADTFVRWRRRAANLTPVSTAPVNKAAKPGFLTVDHEAREAAHERGDEYERHLREREAEARAAEAEEAGAKTRSFSSALSLFMSCFTLASMIAGAVWQVTWIGTVLDRYTTSERLEAVLRSHPVAFVVAVTVISFHVYQFIAHRKWRADA